MKQVFVIGGLAALALTAATVRPASADECWDGRYVAPVVAYNHVVVDRNCNLPFAQEYNREYRRDNDRNDRNDHNNRNRDRDNRWDRHDRR